MAEYISKVQLPGNSIIYEIKDSYAREEIEKLSTTTRFLGVTTTALTDQSTTNPITINNKSVTAEEGDITLYNKLEFVWDGTRWQEFGDASIHNLGSFAYANSGYSYYTPTGDVTKPTFSGDPISLNATNISVKVSNAATPTGNTGYKPSGTISINSVTAAGTITNKSFTGTQGTVTVKNTAAIGVPITGSTASAAGYQVVRSISRTTNAAVTVPSTTVTGVSSVGTVPSFAATVTNEVLSFTWNAGTTPTTKSFTVGASGAASVTQPVYTPTYSYISGTIAQSAITASGSFTPSGEITASFSGTPVSVSGTFTGTTSYLYVSAYGGGTVTPTGNVTKPTFTGTSSKIVVQPGTGE